jgi:nicotinamide-nucleotide amidase
MSIASEIIDIAREKRVMIATAESCTAGLVAAAITEVAGSSAAMERGFVTYSNAAKIDMLGVSPETLEHYGAVSEPVAREMAAGARARSLAQVAVSLTGIAGPGGSDHKPEGRVCFGISSPASLTAETVDFGALGRSQVRAAACAHALHLLKASLQAL